MEKQIYCKLLHIRIRHVAIGVKRQMLCRGRRNIAIIAIS